jgi:hypothetical protein
MTALCTILMHPQHLYEVFFHEASYAAVDEWLQHIEAINAQYAPDDLVYYLINTPPDDELPVIYVMRAAQQYASQHPQRPRTRTATLYRDELQSVIIYGQNLLTSWIRDKREVVRFFKRSQREDALGWLMSGD